MSAADSGGGVPGVGSFIQWVGTRALRFGGGGTTHSYYVRALGGYVSKRVYKTYVAQRNAQRGQAGTVTPIGNAPPKPPPSSPPPTINPNAPRPKGGVLKSQAWWIAGWIGAQQGLDWWQAQRKKAEDAEKKRKAEEKKRKAEEEKRKKQVEAEAAKRREILYRTTHGRAPPTAGRGPITGPWSGDRRYDLPRNPAAPKVAKPSRQQVDVFVHPDRPPAVEKQTTAEIYREMNIDPFYEQVIRARNAPVLKGPEVKVDPALKPYQLPKGSPWSTASGALSTAKGIYAKYGQYAGYGALIYGALAPKGKSSKKHAYADAPLTGLDPGAVESPQYFAEPQLAPETARKCKPCKCKPKKKRGKRKLRNICYKGSYVETRRGTRKRKREQVPCQA